MKRLSIYKVILAVWLTAGLVALIPVSAARADCSIIWTQECSSEVVISGYDTVRISGTYTVHDYHEEWGEYSTTIPLGYWFPQDGTEGVRWSCPNNLPTDLGFGWKTVFKDGAWEDVVEEQPIPDRYGRDPSDPFWIPTYIEHMVLLGISGTACSYIKADETIRWWDSSDEWLTIPFQDILIVPWEKIIVITNYYQLEVPLDYPVAQVTRSPWPRAIAGQPVSFSATVSPVQGSSEVIDACTPDIRNYQLHIRLTPIVGALPEWMFNERDWSIEPTTAHGWEVSHTYQTASYDLPATGPSLDGAAPLPAYQVTVRTAWLVEANRTWTDFYGQPHETGWQVVDLTQYGYSTSYLITTGATDVTPPPPGIPAQDLPDFFVPVPVVESQSILTSP